MRLNVESRYISGIEDGKISKLVVNARMFDVLKEDELYIVDKFKLKCLSIEKITENELKEVNPIPFGFLTNDLLLSDVYKKFHYKQDLNREYCIFHFRKISKNSSLATFRLIYYPILKNVTYSYDFYNPEYDEKPWRDENASF